MDKSNYIGFKILEKAKLFLYKAFYVILRDNWIALYKDGIFVKINVPNGGNIEQEVEKIIGISSFTE